MNRFIILILFYSFIHLEVYSQDKPKLLKIELQKIKNSQNKNKDSALIKIYKELGDFYFTNEPKSALYYFRKMDSLAQITKQKDLQAYAINGKGISYYVLSSYDKSLRYFLEALKLFKKINNIKGIAIGYNNIGLIYSIQKKERKAIVVHFLSIKYAKQINDSNMLERNFFNLSIALQKINKLDSALSFINKAITINKQSNNTAHLIMAINRKADILIQIKRYNEALSLLNYLINDLKIINKWELCLAYSNLAQIYNYRKNNTLAIKYGHLSVQYAKAVNSLWDLNRNTKILSEIYATSNNYKKAYKYLQLQNSYNDSLYNIDKENNLNHLLLKEEELKSNKFIQKNILQETKIRKNKIINFILIASLFLFLIFILFLAKLLNSRKRLNIKLKKKNIEILNKTESLKIANKKLHKLNEFKENMTSMIIHDLKNPLNAIINTPWNISLEKQNKYIKQLGKQILTRVLNILDIDKYEDAQLVVNKIDYSLLELSQNAVNEVLFLAKQKNIKIENKITPEISVKADKEITERIFINILTNAIKYTLNNGKIILKLKDFISQNGFVEIQISDTGQGIPKSQVHSIFEKFKQISAKKSGKVRSTGLGLTFCKMAVESHGGKIGVESELKKGTTLWFTLPTGNLKNIKHTENRTIQKETTENKVLEFTPTEKEILKPFLAKFQKLEVYEHTEILKIIEQIDCNKSKKLQKWNEEMKHCIYTMNEENYEKLINLI